VKSLVRVVASLLGAGLLYSVWLAAVLAAARPASPMPFWFVLTAPVATAFGFGLGSVVGDRIIGRRSTPLLRACLWPLAGCVVGAVVVYPFGPMLIVFGMFGLGTAAVVASEVIAGRKTRSANNGIQTDAASRRR
jgi:FtsH-binding integral membrane protein